MSDTHETILTINHEAGLHLRPAALFVRTAKQFDSTIVPTNLSRDPTKTCNAKSMFCLMQLGVSQGHQVHAKATGPDTGAAITALQALVDQNFAEQS